MAEAAAAMVRRAYESFLKGDLTALIGMLDVSVSWSVPRALPQGGEFEGLEGVAIFFKGLRAAWNPLELEIEAVTEASPGVVAVIVAISGTLAGDEVAYGAVHVFNVDRGKVTRFREYVDLDAPFAG